MILNWSSVKRWSSFDDSSIHYTSTVLLFLCQLSSKLPAKSYYGNLQKSGSFTQSGHMARKADDR